MKQSSDLDSLLANLSNDGQLKAKFGLNYNPFPRSGIAIIDESDQVMGKLVPLYKNVSRKIVDYITDVINPSTTQKNDGDYLSLIIRGDYGTGKTQTLMYIKYLLRSINVEGIRPYVIYIDNPGQKLPELIGSIVEQIGVENFRRFLWNIFLDYLNGKGEVFLEKNDNEIIAMLEAIRGDILSVILPREQTLFDHQTSLDAGIFEKQYLNYKLLLDELLNISKPSQKKEIVKKLKEHMIKCYTGFFKSSVVADYFYDIVSDNLGINKSWDIITSGSSVELNKREVYILKAIVSIVKREMGYTSFIILVDEFEEITTERLKPTDIDNYLRNLRSLIDREKNWCSVFAMTGLALENIRTYSPPLAARIDDRIVDLQPLDKESCCTLISNYLSLARENSEYNIYPFSNSAVETLLNTRDKQLAGAPRFIVKACYMLLQRAVEELNTGAIIDDEFVRKHMVGLLK